MTIDNRYVQALALADYGELGVLEAEWRQILPTLSSTALVSTLGQRVGHSLSDSSSVVELAELLYAKGLSQLALKTLYRLPRQERTSQVKNKELVSRISAIRQTTVAAASNTRVVVCYEQESELEYFDPLLPGKLKRVNLPLPAPGVQSDSDQLTALQSLADQHLTQPNTVLVTLANGDRERQTLSLSRISDSPALILQLDTVVGSASTNRATPFIPTNTGRNFPPSCWLRYGLSAAKTLQAWDISSGQPIEAELEEDLLGIALTRLLARQVLVHDVVTFPSAPFESILDQPAPLTRWFGRDRQDAGKLGVTPSQFFASLADYFWRIQSPSVKEQVLRSRLELAIANTDVALRDQLLDLSATIGHHEFIDQLNVRSLWVKNDFIGVRDYFNWMQNEPDQETSRLARQARAAVKLEQLLADTSGASRVSSDASERIVCFLHASVPQQSGGYAIRAHGILTNLAQQGVHVTAITRPGYPDVDQGDSFSDTVDGIEYHRLPGLASYMQGEAEYMLECVDIFKDQLIRHQATKVHVRSTYLIAIPAIIAAHQLGLKIVYEVSGLWELVYQELEPAESLHKRAPFGEYWETLAVRYADEILTMNEPMTELLVSRGADPARVNLAPNAVDTSLFVPAFSRLRTTPRIGYIGSIVAYENLGLLVQAAKILKEEGLRFNLRIIGDGNAAANLRQLVKSLGVEDVVSMPGRIPHANVSDEYAKMDIMVYPRKSTLATDTVTPLKPFEALAMGKAVVVSDIPPLREISGDGTRALLFEPGKVEPLAEALRTLLSDWRLRQDLGKAGRAWVEEERSWATVVQAFTQAYSRL